MGDKAQGCDSDPHSEDIAILQARLHDALAQLEQSNIDCVELAQLNEAIKAELKATEDKCRNLTTENTVLRRRLSALYPDEEGPPPKPGPSRKSFENLTPRNQKRASHELQAQVLKTSEERGILPEKLAAYLTYR